jgi:hypothetical protein
LRTRRDKERIMLGLYREDRRLEVAGKSLKRRVKRNIRGVIKEQGKLKVLDARTLQQSLKQPSIQNRAHQRFP